MARLCRRAPEGGSSGALRSRRIATELARGPRAPAARRALDGSPACRRGARGARSPQGAPPPKDALADPSLRYVRARALEAAGRSKEGEPLLADPKEVVASYGPWWAI